MKLGWENDTIALVYVVVVIDQLFIPDTLVDCQVGLSCRDDW